MIPTQTIDQALTLLPPKMDSRAARVMLAAIGLQESGFVHRWQVINPKDPSVMGPARGFWQFEQGGGVKGVLNHPSTQALAQQVCEHFNTPPTPQAVFSALSQNDVLAAAFARLLLWTDSRPIPLDPAQAWAMYLAVWRPGKPHPATWPLLYREASDAFPA